MPCTVTCWQAMAETLVQKANLSLEKWKKEWYQHGIEFQAKLRSHPQAIHKIQPNVSLRS